jgi:hypothetical protein
MVGGILRTALENFDEYGVHLIKSGMETAANQAVKVLLRPEAGLIKAGVEMAAAQIVRFALLEAHRKGFLTDENIKENIRMLSETSILKIQGFWELHRTK